MTKMLKIAAIKLFFAVLVGYWVVTSLIPGALNSATAALTDGRNQSFFTPTGGVDISLFDRTDDISPPTEGRP